MTAAESDISVADRLATVREDPTRRRLSLVIAVVVGLGLATVHWLGLVVGGALVGITRQSVPRAVLTALGFGVVVLGVFAAVTPVVASLAFAGLEPLSWVAVALALVAPAWGALVRLVL